MATTRDFEFWTGYYKDDKMDSFKWASDKAYLDMNRTMTFKDCPNNNTKKEKDSVENARNGWRDDATDKIEENFKNLSSFDSFDKFHEETCKEIIEVYGEDKLVERDGTKRTDKPVKLTYGQAQKWLNMTLKYIWLLYRINLLEKENAEIVKEYENFFHVPLDSYILRYVAKQKRKKEEFPSTKNGLNNYNFDSYWNEWGSAWSKINDYADYSRYQAKLKNAIGNAQIPPRVGA